MRVDRSLFVFLLIKRDFKSRTAERKGLLLVQQHGAAQGGEGPERGRRGGVKWGLFGLSSSPDCWLGGVIGRFRPVLLTQGSL